MEVNYMKKFLSFVSLFLFSLIAASPSLAHVTVKPNQVGVGAYQTFNVSVPNERDNPTTGIRLVIPANLTSVSPNVKPGWNIEIKKAGESMKGEILNTGEKAPDPESVTEIIWTGGSVPAGMRDDFFFSAKAPADEGELNWQAYQTYSDGEVVTWDLSKDAQPKNAEGKEDFSVSGPYSTTKVVNDLASSPKPETEELMTQGSKETNLPLILSAIAVVISGVALGITFRKR